MRRWNANVGRFLGADADGDVPVRRSLQSGAGRRRDRSERTLILLWRTRLRVGLQAALRIHGGVWGHVAAKSAASSTSSRICSSVG